MYGSGHVGIAGAIISKTNIENILQLNLLATDFYRKEAYPSYLYYNPNPEDKEVTIYVGENEVKIYDAVKREFISPRAKENFTFKIEKENSAVLVFVPKSTKVEEREGKLYADNVIIDYHYSKINKNE